MSFIVKGNWKPTFNFLDAASKFREKLITLFEQAGRDGVIALSSATPIDTGLTSSSWDYKIKVENSSIILSWTNSNVVDGILIAIIIQYGHGTRNGGYVQGRDYINPALRPIFDNLADKLTKEVNSL